MAHPHLANPGAFPVLDFRPWAGAVASSTTNLDRLWPCGVLAGGQAAAVKDPPAQFSPHSTCQTARFCQYCATFMTQCYVLLHSVDVGSTIGRPSGVGDLIGALWGGLMKIIH